MKTSRPIFFVLLLALAGIIFFIVSSYKDSRRFRDSQDWINHTHQVINLIDSTHNLLTSLESAVAGYAITGNGTFLSKVSLHNELVKSNVRNISKRISDNEEQRKSLKGLNKLIEAKIDHHYHIIEGKKFSSDSSQRLIAGLEGKRLMDSISEGLMQMRTREQKFLQVHIQHTRELSHQSLQFTIGGSIIVTLFIVGLLFQLNKDNTLRKHAEDEVQKTALKYRQFVENAGVVTYSADGRGDFTFISNQVEELTGYTVEELIWKNFTVLLPPDWIDTVSNNYISQIIENKRETTLVFPIIHKNGERRWVEQDAVLITKEDGSVEFQCVVRDITEKVQVTEKLKETEEEKKQYQSRVQSILDNAPLLIYVKDLQGKYIVVNKRFTETFNIPGDEAINKTVYDIEKKESADKYTAADRYVIENKRSVELEDTMHLEGGTKHLLTIKFPLFDHNNEVFGVSGFMKDITDMVRNREELIAARQKAERAEMLQEQFLANMSHEIRTPMNGIVGMGNLLMQTPLLPEQKEYVRIIQNSSDNLLVLINDILDLSKIKAGKINIEKVPFHLPDVIHTLSASFNLKSKEKGILFSVLMHPSVPQFLKGDQHRLNQVLNNLLSNAIKFTEKGYVTLEISNQQLTDNTVTLCIQVTDSGIGIDNNSISLIFENFAQASSDTTRKFGGTGLGLAITKQLVEMQKGTISVSSKPSVGTVFTVLLPYEIAEKTEVKQTGNKDDKLSCSGQRDFTGKRILVAEDNEINQFVLNASLQRYNIDVIMTSTGKQAVEYLENNDPVDLILMDIRMPEMDGFQAVEYIRKKLNSTVPIIILTASALGNERQRSFEIGANGYVTKPFAPEELHDCLERFLSDKTSSSPSPATEKRPYLGKIYDLTALLQLKDINSIKTLYGIFEATVPSSLEELRKKAVAGDWDQVYELAHKLKSSLGVIQVKDMLTRIQTIEGNARFRNKLDEILPIVEECIATYREISPLIKTEIERQTA
jgi:PAS domain S-box-containing protein